MPRPAHSAFAFLVMALCLSGCHKETPRTAVSATPGIVQVADTVPTVSYCQPEMHSVNKTLSLTGTVVVDKTVQVPSRATGQIVNLYVETGQRVSRGQVLATVDTSDSQLSVRRAQAQLDQELAALGMNSPGDRPRSVDEIPSVLKAKANLTNAKENLDRYEELHRQHLVSDEEYSSKKTTYVVAKADYQAAVESVNQSLASMEASRLSVEIAKKKVTDAVITAPVSGVIDQATTAPGAYVTAGSQTGITVLKDRPLFVAVDVPQEHLSQLAVGKVMSFVTPAYPDRQLAARVTQIGGAVNDQTGALPVRAEMLSTPSWIHPGVSAKVELLAQTLPDQLLIPQAAVLTQAGRSKVFVVESQSGEEAQVKEVKVQTGQRAGSWVVVEGDLEPHQKLISSDLLGLSNGSRVRLGKPLDVKPVETDHLK